MFNITVILALFMTILGAGGIYGYVSSQNPVKSPKIGQRLSSTTTLHSVALSRHSLVGRAAKSAVEQSKNTVDVGHLTKEMLTVQRSPMVMGYRPTTRSYLGMDLHNEHHCRGSPNYRWLDSS